MNVEQISTPDYAHTPSVGRIDIVRGGHLEMVIRLRVVLTK